MAGITKIPTIWSSASGGPGRLLRKRPRLSKDRTGPTTRNASSSAKRKRKTWTLACFRATPSSLPPALKPCHHLHLRTRAAPLKMTLRQPRIKHPRGGPLTEKLRKRRQLLKRPISQQRRPTALTTRPPHETRHPTRRAAIREAAGTRNRAATGPD